MSVLPHRGPQRLGQRVIGQGQVSFQPRRSDVLQFPDQPPGMVQARPQLLLQSRAPQVGG